MQARAWVGGRSFAVDHYRLRAWGISFWALFELLGGERLCGGSKRSCPVSSTPKSRVVATLDARCN